MARVVPWGTPDPDADRRFAERRFPLLEPVGWRGERHRGGYGVVDPGSRTICLGLIFGPRSGGASAPRLAVSVGDRFMSGLSDAETRALVRLNARLAVHVPAADRPSGAFCRGAVASASIVVEGEPVEFQVHTVGRRWLGYGLWRGFAVELEGSGIQPADVALQLADVGPAGHPRR